MSDTVFYAQEATLALLLVVYVGKIWLIVRRMRDAKRRKGSPT